METITVRVADATIDENGAPAPSWGAPKMIRLADNALKRHRVLDTTLRPEWPKWMATLGGSFEGRGFSAKDAQEAFEFMIGQLAYQENILLERYFTQMQYKEVLAGCISYEAGEWAETVDYDVFEPKGNARWVDNSANDIPNADVAYAHKTIPVKTGGAAYSFTQMELIQSSFMKRPLSERRMMAAIESYERFVNVIATQGDTTVNFTGLVNNGNVTHALRPSGKTWSDGTASPTDIASDVAYAMNAIWVASGFNEVPSAVGIPSASWEHITTAPMSSTFPNRTILDYLKDNNLAKERGVDVKWFPFYAANGAGAGVTDRVVYYVMKNDTLVQHIPMPLRFLAPQMRGYSVDVPGMFRLGPVEVRRATNVYYQDGV